MAQVDVAQFTCPLPRAQYEHIVLGHGSGGKLTSELIETLFLPVLGDGQGVLQKLEDQATVEFKVQSSKFKVQADDGEAAAQAESRNARLALTTDSFVVQPLFFPGGDIGSLAVHGTVNDLAVGGATPRFLAAAFILEEGLPTQTLARAVTSMRQACDEAGVALVTGDTKVVNRGKGDGIYITTTGIGTVDADCALSIHSARPGDAILLSGTLGDHGVAIMSVREGIAFDTPLLSDSAALNGLTRAMLDACPTIRCMRDPTRGGLAGSVNELAAASSVGVKLNEAAIPMRHEVKAACEMLGLDPLHVANEGKLIAVCPPQDAQGLLEAMREHPLGRNAAIIGQVTDEHPGMVLLSSLVGGGRVVMQLAGEQLPRIC